ncbi:hypothetical protein FWH09_03275 [Candidatus Saccharibacteria bacterium]|nr:hypothetical protein [Candidatus Saccharibacteria bacterium]
MTSKIVVLAKAKISPNAEPKDYAEALHEALSKRNDGSDRLCLTLLESGLRRLFELLEKHPYAEPDSVCLSLGENLPCKNGRKHVEYDLFFMDTYGKICPTGMIIISKACASS